MTFRPASFRTQLLSANGLLVLTTVALGAGAAFLAQRDIIRRQIRASQGEEAQAFAQVCRQATLLKNETLMVGYTQMLASRTGVAYAYFVDPRGVFRAHTDLNYLHRTKADWATSRSEAVEESASAQVENETLGTAVLAYRKDHRQALEHKALMALSRGLLLAALLAGAVGILLALGLAGLLMRPIQRLARAAARLGSGDLAARVSPGGSREVHHLARTFNQMAERLSELDRIKDEMISMVSHDLRTPLGGITSYADTLRSEGRGPLNDIQKQYLGIILENAEGLGRFVSDMLDLAKIKAGRMEYRLKNVSVTPVLQRVVDLFQQAVEREGARITLEGPSGLFVWADEPKLDRVLANLVSNAFKHLPEGDGRITVSAHPQGPLVVFSVEDNGRGIPEKDRGKLFQRFTQIEGHAVGRGEGTGLGLLVVKTFLEAMKGRVWLEESKGGGARFLFSLPSCPVP